MQIFKTRFLFNIHVTKSKYLKIKHFPAADLVAMKEDFRFLEKGETNI